MVRANVTTHHCKVDRTASGYLVVASFGADIVEMESDESVGEGGEMGFVIESSGEVFDAGVAGIVPVSNWEVGRELIKEGLEFVVDREL